MLLLALAMTLAVAYAIDVVAIRYRAACHDRQRVRAANLGAVLEALGWLPFILAFETGNPIALAAAAVVGSWLAHHTELR